MSGLIDASTALSQGREPNWWTPTAGSDVPVPRSMVSAVADLPEKVTLVRVVNVLQELMNETGKGQ